MEFTSIHCSRNAELHLHTDPHYSGNNYIITFGSYKAGGELFTHEKDGPHSITLPDSQPLLTVGRKTFRAGMKITGRKRNTRGQIVCFDPTLPHMVLPCVGDERLAVVYYHRKLGRRRVEEGEKEKRRDIEI